MRKAASERPFLLPVVLLAGFFLPGILHPFVSTPLVVLAAAGLGFLVTRPAFRCRFLAFENARLSGGARSSIMAGLTVLVILGSVEYLAVILTDTGLVRYFTPMETVYARSGGGDFRTAHMMADDYREPDPVLLWRSKPKRPYNRQRFKGPLVEVPKPSGVFRVICYGDSNTDGSRTHGHWPGRLQERLERRGSIGGPVVEVLNAGIAGYSSHQGRLRLELEIDRFEPDLVLFSFGWNDVVEVAGADRDFERPSVLSVAVQRALLRYRFYLVLSHLLQPSADPSSAPLVSRVPLGGYVDNLRSVLATTKARSVGVAFLTRPVRMPPAELETATGWRSRVPSYNRALIRFAEEAEAPVIDVEAHFRGSSQFFGDLNHFNVAGQEEVADFLAERIAGLGLLWPDLE